MKKLKIALIMPAIGKKDNQKYIASWKMEPLGIAALASLTPPDVEVDFFDDRLERIPYDNRYDLVGITVETYTARRAYQIAARFRKRNTPVILGGFHPTLMPDEAIHFADALLLGEAEGVWPGVLEDVKHHRLKRIYRAPGRSPLSGVRPRREIFQKKKYVSLGLVEASRGCTKGCSFCSVAGFFNRTQSQRPPAEIAAEVESLGRKYIFFVDDNIALNRSWARQLFRELAPLKIQWISQMSLDLARDEELISLMAKSGCCGVLIGLESLNQKNLDSFDKGIKGSEFSLSLRRLREYGLCVYATFLFGYDHDTRESFEMTLEFALKNRFFFTAFNHLTPFPGTALYQKLAREKRLLYQSWWLNPRYHYGDLAFIPRNMSPEEVSEGCREARKKFYSLSSIFRRGLDWRCNCRSFPLAVTFLAQNLLAQKEVEKKYGLPLGEGLD
ncbi:MAG: radical SAM protein [bacterium]